MNGFIRESGSLENIDYAQVIIAGSNIVSQSNKYGFYSLTFPVADSISVRISKVGYATQTIRITGQNNQQMDIKLATESIELETVTILAGEYDKKSLSPKISTINVPVQQLKDAPSLLGEKDILKAIQLMPGVQSGTEGSNGLFVRGGSADQNLILMDEAKVYNISHLFGFFSIFNGDALKNVEFIKGGFPARYGGRISSVLDVQMKEGNKQGVHGELGVGLISSRLTLEGPIKKEKSSFIISARRSYPDLLLSLAKNASGAVLKTNFYDLNAKANFEVNPNNRIYFSTYLGKDNMFQRVNKKADAYRNMGFSWGNKTGTLRWSRIISPRLFANLTLIYSNFKYSLENATGLSSQQYSSTLNESGIKYDFELLPNSKHAIRFGLNVSRLNFRPNVSTFSEDSEVKSRNIEKINALDAAIYIEDVYTPVQNLVLNYGLRIARFTPSGQSYTFVEPRLAATYNFAENWALKTGYSVMNQPVQLLTNNGLGLSVDIWVPSTANMPPQNSRQLTFGVTHDLNDKISIELEVYKKKMNNILAFKEGASVLSMIELFRDRDFTSRDIRWNDVSTSGSGNAHGLELFIHKRSGKLTGWTGYTWSKTVYQFEKLNDGKAFYPTHDRRHQLSLVGAYKKSDRVKFAGNFVFSTGNPVTQPRLSYSSLSPDPITGLPELNETIIDYGNQRNNSRTPVYHRLDLSVQWSKQKKRGKRTWEFGIYNILGTKNVFAYEIDINGRRDSNDQYIRIKQLNTISLMLFIPSIAYSFKF
ncbi:MAG TPA: carboxypeptidase-like regulatory domain-containing protein [Dyadobacter sp.]|nr:carboxypeptidase-like regulatory domain-containing protein [Dyadobacter sp.]